MKIQYKFHSTMQISLGKTKTMQNDLNLRQRNFFFLVNLDRIFYLRNTW